jgi:hypothetical protein
MLTLTGLVTQVSSFNRKSGEAQPFIELEGAIQINLVQGVIAPPVGQTATLPCVVSSDNGRLRFKAVPTQNQPSR